MADLKAICEEVATALSTIPDLNAHAVTEQINTPAVTIEPQVVDFTTAMARGTEKWDITLRVLAAPTTELAGQEGRFEFFGGAKDIKDVIESHVPLLDGSVAQSVFVRSAQNFGVWEISGIAYIGGEISLDVYA